VLPLPTAVYSAAVSDLGREVEFADGKFVVDEPIASMIMQATDGKPERFAFKDAMQLATKASGRVSKTDLMRAAGVTDHLRRFGI